MGPVKCKFCKQKRYLYLPGDGLCDRCWELQTRIKNDQNLAVRVLKKLGYEVNKKC